MVDRWAEPDAPPPHRAHTPTSLADVASRCKIEGYTFDVGFDGSHFLRIKCDGTCNVTGKRMPWSGRKWRLSVHMTDGEIAQTALKAALTAMEHEVRERFTYRGVAVFDPHYDIEALVALRSDPSSIREREDHSGGR